MCAADACQSVRCLHGQLMRFTRFLLCLTTFLLASGCSTFASRVKEKSAVFATLDPVTQTRLKEGRPELGDSPDLVYIALGTPDAMHDQISADGSAVVWVYYHYWQEYQGESMDGVRMVPVTDPKTGVTSLIQEPMQRSIYHERAEERMRVTFKNGKVTVIERPKP